MNKRSKALLMIGTMIVLLSIFLFFMLTEDRITITWMGFAFILFVEIVLFGGLVLIEFLSHSVSQIMIRIIGGIALLGYASLSIIISIIYMSVESEAVRTYLVIQVILAVVLVIILVVAFISALSVKSNDSRVVSATTLISSYVDKLNLLKSDKKYAPYSVALAKVAEGLRYSDTSTTVQSDGKIEANIDKLELTLRNQIDDKEKEVDIIIEELIVLINQRKIEVKNTKSGGI